MKTKIFRFFVVSLSFASFYGNAQSGVGINTTNPQKTLDVAGSMIIDGNLDINLIDPVTKSEDGVFLMQLNDNSIKEVYPHTNGAALSYFQQYVLENVDGDYVFELGTGIDASKYILVVISAYFDREVQMPPLSSHKNNFSTVYVRPFVDDGEWFLTADYTAAYPDTNGSWVLDVLILPKSVSKIIAPQIVDMNNSGVSSALSPIMD